MAIKHVILAGLILSAALFGQQLATNGGAINGTVTDSSGAAVPNVKVTITSPAMQGAQTFTTNEQGIYRFPDVPIGLFRMTFEAPGFATMVRDQVNITLGFTATINISMTPATQQQTVVVTGETPLVDTTNVTVQGGFNLQQLNEVPNGRDMWSIIGLTPGMTNSTLDVGGSAVGNQVGYTSFGYGGQNRVMIDGINTSEGTSGAGFYFDYGSFTEFTVGTAANDASMPVPGNQVNAVIKTGSNQWHGDAYFDYENPNFQGHNISQAQILQGAGLGQRIAAYYDPNGDFGGPILKDRVWFYLSIRDQTVGASVLGFPIQAPGTVASYAYDRNATYKLNGNINKSHRLSSFAQWNPILKPQRSSTSTYYEDAMYYQKAEAWVGNVQYSGVWSPKFFTNVLVGTWGYNFPQVPYGAFPGDPGTPTCPCAQTLPPVKIGQLVPRMSELVSGDTAGSYAEVRLDPRRYQIEPTGSYFLDNFLHTSHQFRFGYTYEHELENDQYYAPVGGVTEVFNSKTATGTALPDFSTPYQIQATNNPRIDVSVIEHHGLYLTDQFKIGKRLTVNAGVRWDYYSSGYRSAVLRTDCIFCGFFYQGQSLGGATLPVNTSLQNGAFPNATVSTFPHDIAPRFGVAYDLTGKGRTILKVSYGQYYSYPSTNIALAVNPVQAATATFTWNNPNNAAFNLSQLGAIVGSPSIAQGSTVQPNLKDERFDDMGIVLQHQLSNTLSVEGGFIFRELHHAWETINEALPASLYTLATVKAVPATWDAQGNVLTTRNITLYDIPGKIPASQNQFSSPSGNNSIYRNLEFTINKRLSQKFTAVGSFYWTHTTAPIQADTSTGAPTIGIATNPNGLINNGESYSSWTSHVTGTYFAPWGIQISPVLRMQEGSPLLETYAVTGLNVGTQYIPLAPYGAFRNPDLYVFDIRLQKDLKFKERYRVSLFFDLFNVFNSNTANSESAVVSQRSTVVNVAGNVDFGQKELFEGFQSPSVILPPRIFRIGARFSF
jgi:hypothetical protein